MAATTPTSFARITADTLNAGAVRQITRFLQGTLTSDTVGSPNLSSAERDVLRHAADALETILSWQTPKAVKS